MKTTVLKTLCLNKCMLAIAACILFASAASAQTYTTQADGNWTSASTWVGGLVPSRTITSGMTVNIKHDVTCNVAGDLTVGGTLNITGDTLRFASAFTFHTIVSATGKMTITKGGYIQDMTTKRNNFTINAGRVIFDSALVVVSKDFTAAAGTKRTIKNSTVRVGEDFSATGTSTSRVLDTIQNSLIEPTVTSGGNYNIGQYVSTRVSNARVWITNGSMKNDANSDIVVLAGAANNYGFNLIKVSKDLENIGSWDARIDAQCVAGSIKGNNMAAIDLTRSEDCSVDKDGTTASGAAPELVLMNPTLVSGVANKQGAVYRFANITTGVDAEVKLVKFSRNDIVMQSIDLSGLGWDKAFQPQFGLAGLVQPNQNWYVDFEMTFFQAGTNKKQKLSKVDMTALDVDGDGLSISEYATFEAPSNIIYSTVSYLTDQSAGLLGQVFTCPLDNLPSVLISCVACGGDGKSGIWNIDECAVCDGSGFLFLGCNHPYESVNGNSIVGPVENFTNIDTLATQVMATYQYTDKDRVKFRYGAKSANVASNGAGIRLNSLWFRQFSMTPPKAQIILPVKLVGFTAQLVKSTVNLSWKGYEENFSHYVVQRSTDGKNYRDAGIVFAINNGSELATYEFKDMNVSSATGMVYYRLLLVDKINEATSFSDVRVVRLTKEVNGVDLVTYPNPATTRLNMAIPVSMQGKAAQVEVIGLSGTILNAMQLGSAGQTETVDIAKLARGVYFVKITCNGETVQQRFVKN